jgi:3-deoxy-7-phosphoheptulonate synthase
MFTVMSGVADAVPVSKPWKLVSREVKPDDTFIEDRRRAHRRRPVRRHRRSVRGREPRAGRRGGHGREGGGRPLPARRRVQAAHVTLRVPGHEEDGLKILAEARDKTGLPIVTEVMDTRDVELVARYADVPADRRRNMQNFSLLEAVGAQPKAVHAQARLSATIQEFLMAAEYIVKQGNYKVVLCERGIRTFETMTRTRSTSARSRSSSGSRTCRSSSTRRTDRATARRCRRWARAAVALGADGLMVEVHPAAREGAVGRTAVADAGGVRDADGVGARDRDRGGAQPVSSKRASTPAAPDRAAAWRYLPAALTAAAMAFITVKFAVAAHDTLTRTRDGACIALDPTDVPAALKDAPSDFQLRT